MSDYSANHLDQITVAQSAKETKANELFDSHSPASFGGRRASTTSGLTLGLYGGKLPIDGTDTPLPSAGAGQVTTLVLPSSATRYVEVTRAGTIQIVTTPTPGAILLATAVTGTSTISSTTDHRGGVALGNYNVLQYQSSIAVTTADVTLTAAQARCTHLRFTGALTASRNVIVPNGPQRFTCRNDCTGGTAPGIYTLTIKTASGSGVQLPRGVSIEVYSDGTNVVAVAPAQFAQVLAYAATLAAHDATAGERIVVGTLTGNITVPAPSNPTLGQRLAYSFTQDGTGGRTITWNAAFKKAADGAGTANQVGCTQFQFDGTSWVQVGGALAWA